MSHSWSRKRKASRERATGDNWDNTMELLRQVNQAFLAGDVDGWRRAMAACPMPTDAEVLAAALRPAPRETDEYTDDGEDAEYVAYRKRTDEIAAFVEYVRSTPADQLDHDRIRRERARMYPDEAPDDDARRCASEPRRATVVPVRAVVNGRQRS